MAFAILAAPRFRNITGEGQHVAVAMYDSMVYLMYREIAIYECTGEVPGPSGIGVPLIAPYAFEAKDGLVIIAVASQTIWERFCRARGWEDLVNHPRSRRLKIDIATLRAS